MPLLCCRSQAERASLLGRLQQALELTALPRVDVIELVRAQRRHALHICNAVVRCWTHKRLNVRLPGEQQGCCDRCWSISA